MSESNRDTIIHSALLFDGRKAHADSAVQFNSRTGYIVNVWLGTKPTIPDGVLAVDGTGCTLLPGMIDAHIHAFCEHNLPPDVDQYDSLKYALRCGITTVCDMHSPLAEIKQFRARIQGEIDRARKDESSAVVTPDLKSSLYSATVAEGWPKPILYTNGQSAEIERRHAQWPRLTTETAADFVLENKSNGADYIKLMQEDCCSYKLPTDSIPVATPELQKTLVRAAHESGIPVVAHATSIKMTSIVLRAGVDGLAHTFFEQSPTEEILQLYAQTAAFVIPTLVATASITGEEQSLRDQFVQIARERGMADDFGANNLKQCVKMSAPGASFNYACESVRALKERGIDVVAGTDSITGYKGTAFGVGLWMELHLYVDRCGLTPTQALASATSVPARRMRFDDRGTIEPKKRADLVLVKGNVLENLSCFWKGQGIAGVWKEGLRAI